MTETPLYIADEIGKIVLRVQTAKLPELQAFDSNIQGVFYEYGPGIEILETLKQKDESQSFKLKKYPLVALILPFTEHRGETIGVYGRTDFTLVFAYHTRPEYKTSDRYEKSFKPVLYPIYLELINQLKLSGLVFSEDSEFAHDKTDYPYYGRENKNVGNDFLDAIEVTNFTLNWYAPGCELPISNFKTPNF